MAGAKVKNAKVWSVLAILCLIASCENDRAIDEVVDTTGRWFWTPCVGVQTGDGEVTLLLSNPLPTINYSGPPPLNPEYFEIWVSDSRSGAFSLHEKVGITTTSITIQNLQNERPYYFFATSHLGASVDSSGVVMTVPSTKPKMEIFAANAGSPVERLALSSDQEFVTFIQHDKLYWKNLNSTSANLVDQHTYGSNWSPVASKFVYIATITEGNFRYPHSLKLYDPQAQTSMTVAEIPYDDYFIQSAGFSPDGDNIVFLSSEGNSEKTNYDLWTLDPQAGSKDRITNFEELGFYSDGTYTMIDAERMYVDGRFDLMSAAGIFELNMTTGTVASIIQSEWNDRRPSLSPDKTMLAFVSNRTGRDELWLFDLTNSQYRQLTGAQYIFDSRYSNLQWLNAGQLLVTVYNGEEWIPVTIKLN